MSAMPSIRVRVAPAWLLGMCVITTLAASAQEPIAANQTAGRFRTQTGRSLTFACPASDGRLAFVYGTDVYTDDSGICAAAIHAGALRAGQPGNVTITMGTGATAFSASTRNGIASRSYGRWEHSFTVASGAGGTAPATSAGCSLGTVITQTFDAMKSNVAAQYDALVRQVQGDVAKSTALAAQRAQLLQELEALKQRNLQTACSLPPPAITQNAGGGAQEITASTATLPPEAESPGPGAAASPVAPTTTVAPAVPAAVSPPSAVAATSARPAVGAGRAANGLSAASPTACGKPAPQLTVSSASPGAVYLQWDAVAGATGYRVTRSTGGGDLTPTPIQESEFMHADALDYRLTYDYSVTALYGDGCGMVTTTLKPPRPTPPRVLRIGTSGDAKTRRGRVTLTWREGVTDADGFFVIGPGVESGKDVPIEHSLATAAGVAQNFAEPNVYTTEIDNVPSGDHTWLIAPFWETPTGRVVDVGIAARAQMKVGVYRALLTGLRVDNETVDDPANLDGAGDEIYVAAAAYLNGTLAKIGSGAVHGDIRPQPAMLWPPGAVAPTRDGRVQAGTATSSGGIRTGNSVPMGRRPDAVTGVPSATAFPFIAWEGWLGGDEAVLINPTVWEYDGNSSLYNHWQTIMVDAHPELPLSERAERRDSASDDHEERDNFANELSELSKEDARSQQYLTVGVTALATYVALMKAEETRSGGASNGSAGASDSQREVVRSVGAGATSEPKAPAQLPLQIPLQGPAGFSVDRPIAPLFADPPLQLRVTSAGVVSALQFDDGPGPLLKGKYTLYYTLVAVP
jgi:hypothetical protein